MYFFISSSSHTGVFGRSVQEAGRESLLTHCSLTPWLSSPQMPHLEKKLEVELEGDARVIACRFPFPNWTPDQVTGEGTDTVWAYDVSTFQRKRRDALTDGRCASSRSLKNKMY